MSFSEEIQKLEDQLLDVKLENIELHVSNKSLIEENRKFFERMELLAEKLEKQEEEMEKIKAQIAMKKNIEKQVETARVSQAASTGPPPENSAENGESAPHRTFEEKQAGH